MNFMNTKSLYINKRAVFVGNNHEILSFGYTGIAFTDASSGDGYWFHPDGSEECEYVEKTEVWFEDDGYAAGPPNYK